MRNDRKKKIADSSDSKDTGNNNNTKQLDTGNVVTDKDRELIAKILDAHRSTLPGGPLRLPRVSVSLPPSPFPLSLRRNAVISEIVDIVAIVVHGLWTL